VRLLVHRPQSHREKRVMREFPATLAKRLHLAKFQLYEPLSLESMEDFSTLLLGEPDGKEPLRLQSAASGYIPFDEKIGRFAEASCAVRLAQPVAISGTLIES